MDIELMVVGETTIGYEPTIRPATDEEIKAAHGKCSDCKWCIFHHANFGECTNEKNRQYSHEYDVYDSLTIHDIVGDYCRHHEPKS